MDAQPSALPPVRSYFVDEAGDGTLFDRKGRVIVGREGCSRFFMLGLADIEDPATVQAELDELRARLLADPYFNDVPSMRPEVRKTAVAFHATDDLPEVRREERFLHFIWNSVTLVHDVDDTRSAQCGAYYTKRKPLSLAALEGQQGI